MSHDGGDKVNWPARDWRYYGAKPKAKPQPKPQPKVKKGKDVCGICAGVCCGTARALIAEAFGLGCITLSPKVSKGWV